MTRAEPRFVVAAALATMLAGCSLVPVLKVPEVPVAASYKEQAPWTPASPADAALRGDWWTMYGDAELDALQARLIASSPDIAAAIARYDQAQAVARQLRSGLLPTLSLNANAQRDRQSDTKPLRVISANSPNEYGSYTLGAQLDYEIDFWGRIRNQYQSGVASSAAAAGDLFSARLGLQAQLADDYIVLRGLDRQLQLLDETAAAYKRAVDLTAQRHAAGIVSGLDVARAQTQLATAQSQRAQARAQRALSEHAIAALVGESASDFVIAPQTDPLTLADVPVGIPATLLQRRPDIAAAERRVEASNLDIGVARAAYFPAITLGALGGYQSSTTSHFISAPNTFWSIGPSLLLTVFDAGKRKAEVAEAQAALDEQGAKYRGVVLGAFQQVEDNLALLHHYHDAAAADQAAVDAAKKTLELSTARYRAGAINYLDVVTAQTTALQVRSEALDLGTKQLRASVQLVRALGGGWDKAEEPRVRADKG